MGGNASANNMLTGGEGGGSKKPDFVLTLYVYLPLGNLKAQKTHPSEKMLLLLQ